MDWKEIGSKVAGIGLPILGTALGGPAGGVVGKLAASALGLSESASADDVAKAIDSGGGEAVAKLRQLQENHRHEIERLTIEAETTRIAEVNETMRVEANSSGLSSKWRPIWGIVSAAAFFVVCCLCCWLGFIAVSSGNINALNMIPQLITAFAALFSIPGAILGVASWHRGKEKRIQAGEQSAESVAQKLSKKWFG